MSDIPKEIMGEANGIWIEALEEGSPDSALIIARALLSAEARGMERAAKEEWRPIDTAPRDWSDILLFAPDLRSDHRKVCEGYFDCCSKGWKSPLLGDVIPTHWRPLPEPPAAIRNGTEA